MTEPMALDAKALEAARKLFTYQRTFNAIGAAVTRNETGIGISVKAFIEAFGSIDPPPASGEGLEPVEWRCFHCDEVFIDEQAAREHFGFEQSSDPACRIKMGAERSLVRALRVAEAATADAIHGMHDESTEGYKAYYAANSRFNAAVQAAEEAGYERGLADGRVLGNYLDHMPDRETLKQKIEGDPDLGGGL